MVLPSFFSGGTGGICDNGYGAFPGAVVMVVMVMMVVLFFNFLWFLIQFEPQTIKTRHK